VAGTKPATPKPLAQLRQNLTDRLDLEELRTLCFDLQVNYDDLAGQRLSSKARELVKHLSNSGRLAELVDYLSKKHPLVLKGLSAKEILAEPPAPQKVAKKSKTSKKGARSSKKRRVPKTQHRTRPGGLPRDQRERLALDELIDQIKRGQCVLFFGAGVSQEVGLPTGQQLAAALARDLKSPPQPLTQISQAYEETFDRGRLVQRIRQLIMQQPVPGQQVCSYDLLPEIQPLARMIFTTNWDDQIEQAFQRKGIAVVTVRYNQQSGLLGGHPYVVIKLHGDFGSSPDEMVVTPDDYERAYREMSQAGGLFNLLAGSLATTTVLFVGYSLDDDDFRLLYDQVRKVLGAGGRTHYAVMPGASDALKDEWRERNVVILSLTARDLLEHVAHQVRDFINRRQELDYVVGPNAQACTEFYGYTGNGKTELLKKILEHYRLGGTWLQAYVSFEEKPALTPLDLAEELAGQTLSASLAETQKDQAAHLAAEELSRLWATRRVALLFDTSEQIPAPIQDWIESDLVPALEKSIGDLKAQVRMVLAGRKPVPWRNAHFKQRLRVIPLSPFDETAVGEMLDWFVALKRRQPIPSPDRQQIVRDILDITGGHPGCIKQLLDDLSQKSFAVRPDYVHEHRETLFGECVYPTLDTGVLKKLPADLLPALQVVSVFRRLLPDFMDFLIERDYLDSTYVGGMVLLGRLRETHLVLSPRPPAFMYDIDVVVQRILALRMELKQPKRYRELNALALNIYDHQILGQTLDGQLLPSLPSPERRIAYIVEAIFHQLVQARLEQWPSEKVATCVKNDLNKYLKALRGSVAPNELALVLEILAARLGDDPNQADRELLALVERLFPSDGYQVLLKPILPALDKARGGSGDDK
jgi:hypothetical protein